MNKPISLAASLLLCALPIFAQEEKPAPAAEPKAEQATETKTEETGPLKEDFQKYEVGPVSDDIFVVEGEFSIAADGETNKVLQLAAAPVIDGGVLFGKAQKGGTIKAKVRGTSKRRAHPRYAVGLGGVAGYRLRLVPAEKLVEIVKNDERLTTVPCDQHKTETWMWLEFTVKADGEGSLMQGRVWQEGTARPTEPTISLKSEKPPANGKASVWGAPFSDKEIWFDDVEVSKE